jgi:hypothetical protein
MTLVWFAAQTTGKPFGYYTEYTLSKLQVRIQIFANIIAQFLGRNS